MKSYNTLYPSSVPGERYKIYLYRASNLGPNPGNQTLPCLYWLSSIRSRLLYLFKMSRACSPPSSFSKLKRYSLASFVKWVLDITSLSWARVRLVTQWHTSMSVVTIVPAALWYLTWTSDAKQRFEDSLPDVWIRFRKALRPRLRAAGEECQRFVYVQVRAT